MCKTQIQTRAHRFFLLGATEFILHSRCQKLKQVGLADIVMPSMQLCLLRVEARLKDISTFWSDLNYGIFARLM